MKILIKNGTIISSEKSFKGNLLIEEGKIKNISKNAISENNIDKIIDASEKYIFPGGIDPHVHMHLPTPAGFSSDDFRTGTIAAAFGGTTSIIDFVTPEKNQRFSDALNQRLKEAEKSVIDYSFHLSPVYEFNENTESDIADILNKGINSFKVYMAYAIGLKDDDLLKVMTVIAKKNALLTVHAELGDEIEILRNKFAENRDLSPEFHPKSRPAYTEANAVKKIISFAEKTNCKLYVVHVSSKESMNYISEAQKKGLTIYAETCPQYLLLNDEKLTGNFAKTSAYVFSPPLRKTSDNKDLWKAISENKIQTIGTDHCPFTFEQKKIGEKDFRKIPNGAGGVQHRMELLYTYGVLQNKISINKFVDITSTKAAKIFGMYPRKGEIAKNSDADIIIWNPKIKNKISAKTHKQNCDLNIFEGTEIQGKAEIVISNGKVIIENDIFYKENINSKFIKRVY